MTAEELFRSRLIMAPMTRGTDGPFRGLLAELGCTVAIGEMAYADRVVRGERSELALLRRQHGEQRFGAQLAGKDPAIMAEAARVAEAQGADFVDVNLGCPIDDATRRGFGAALLSRATKVAAIVAAMKAAVRIPVTVKLRLGWAEGKPTFLKVARAAQEAGADAVTLHARSRAQRYRRPADWGAVAELAQTVSVPVIGNGDVFTWRQARERLAESGCAAVMVGRWALAKPWIFGEYAAGHDAEPDAEARVAILRRYVDLCREHFGDDEHGRARTRRFLAFHQDFFRRFRPQAPGSAVNSEDPRDWGRAPEGELECWLARPDRAAVDALADWLVDGGPPRPPGPPEDGAAPPARLIAHG